MDYFFRIIFLEMPSKGRYLMNIQPYWIFLEIVFTEISNFFFIILLYLNIFVRKIGMQSNFIAIAICYLNKTFTDTNGTDQTNEPTTTAAMTRFAFVSS